MISLSSIFLECLSILQPQDFTVQMLNGGHLSVVNFLIFQDWWILSNLNGIFSYDKVTYHISQQFLDLLCFNEYLAFASLL